MRLFLFAGEASGDAYAARLVSTMRASSSVPWEFEGVGGSLLAATGAKLHANCSNWGAMGVLQGVAKFPVVLRGARRARAIMAKGKPGVFVPIDFGYANVKLAREAKKLGWKVLYFMPPGSWKRGPQGRHLAEYTDEVVTQFPWSEEVLRAGGTNAHFFGHPLLEHGVSAADKRDTIALLPGSRRAEVKENMPVMAEAVKGLAQAEFAAASTVDPLRLKARWLELAPERTNDLVTSGDVEGVLGRARAAITCSGTATLQAALSGTPMVVIYSLTPLVRMEAKVVAKKLKIKHFSLPNIVLDRDVVPELLNPTAAQIREHLLPLLEDAAKRRAQLEAFAEIREVLSGPGCYEGTRRLLEGLAAQL